MSGVAVVMAVIYPLHGTKNSKPVGCSFTQNSDSTKKYDKDTLLKNNFITNTRIAIDRFSSASTIYTAKGLTGNKNANFYEFLAMGRIPYFIGCATMIATSSWVNKYFSTFQQSKAKPIGSAMSLGIVFYGIAKELSKNLVTKPVKFATGVDVNLPYAKVVYELPEYKDDTDITSIEYHKVFESTEFPRWDLLYGDEKKGEKRNVYYDRIARRLGIGDNLADSDQEVKPKIKEIVTNTTSTKNIVSGLWAATGVALAFQDPWAKFFDEGNLNFFKKSFWNKKEIKKTAVLFTDAFKLGMHELMHGGEDALKANKIAGKALVYTTILATVLGDAKIILNSRKTTKKHSETQSKTGISSVIQTDRKYVVN